MCQRDGVTSVSIQEEALIRDIIVEPSDVQTIIRFPDNDSRTMNPGNEHCLKVIIEIVESSGLNVVCIRKFFFQMLKLPVSDDYYGPPRTHTRTFLPFTIFHLRFSGTMRIHIASATIRHGFAGKG